MHTNAFNLKFNLLHLANRYERLNHDGCEPHI